MAPELRFGVLRLRFGVLRSRTQNMDLRFAVACLTCVLASRWLFFQDSLTTFLRFEFVFGVILTSTPYLCDSGILCCVLNLRFLSLFWRIWNTVLLVCCVLGLRFGSLTSGGQSSFVDSIMPRRIAVGTHHASKD